MDERRPGVGHPFPVGEVEGVLLADLQRRQERAEAGGQGELVQERGQPPACGDDDPFGVDRAAVAGRQPMARGRRRDPGDRPAGADPGAVALRLLEQCAHRALGVDHSGARVPEGLAVDGDLRPPRPGVGGAEQLVLDTDRLQDPGELAGVARRSEVQRAGRRDQPASTQPLQLVETSPGLPSRDGRRRDRGRRSGRCGPSRGSCRRGGRAGCAPPASPRARGGRGSTRWRRRPVRPRRRRTVTTVPSLTRPMYGYVQSCDGAKFSFT